MSGRIRILDDALADQIAAGEVVERPASVVKELIENALDAGARRVEVDSDQGGTGRVRVSDDGHGMGSDDARLSVQRHATSKLRTRDELASIATLGFRGEALPSIASVSRFTLITRTQEALGATRVDIEGGAPAVVSEVGAAPGTSVEVRDLFYNVPARRKFLKSPPTETGHIATVCLRAALANPELTLVLRRDGTITREYLRSASFVQRAQLAFTGERLTPIEGERDGVRIEAALGPPERARNGATALHLFVNGRPVRDASLARAVSFAYGSVLPPGRYPVGALRLSLPAEEVDVNVHPQKHEVRFANGRQVYEAVTRILARSLGTIAWGGPAARSPGYWHGRLEGAPLAGPAAPGEEQASSRFAGQATADRLAEAMAVPRHMRGDSPATEPAASLLPATGFFGSLRVLGQVRRMFLICEGADALHVIDQHAADERVRYDALRRAHAERRIVAQHLLFPERVECTESEVALVERHAAVLEELGLQAHALGGKTVAVHTIPSLLSRAAPERLLRDLLVELERGGERAFGDAIDMAFATMACHAALRAGDPLGLPEAQALLCAMDAVQDFAGHCPHGRPVVSSVPWDDLERRLGR